jgi:hypothetical protein
MEGQHIDAINATMMSARIAELKKKIEIFPRQYHFLPFIFIMLTQEQIILSFVLSSFSKHSIHWIHQKYISTQLLFFSFSYLFKK